MNTKSNNALEEFLVLAEKIRKLEASYSPELEAGYESLLEFLEREPGNRKIYADEMVAAVEEYKNVRAGSLPSLSIDVMAFCMHQLKWGEVLEAAKAESEKHFAPKADSTLGRLIDAFEDDWHEAGDYRLFQANG